MRAPHSSGAHAAFAQIWMGTPGRALVVGGIGAEVCTSPELSQRRFLGVETAGYLRVVAGGDSDTGVAHNRAVLPLACEVGDGECWVRPRDVDRPAGIDLLGRR